MTLPPDMPPPEGQSPDVRLVKRLVVVLTSVMILGVIVIIGLLVTQIARAPAPIGLPDSISLPEGARAQAVTLSRDWVLVLTEDQTLLVFERRSGALSRQMDLQDEH
ncbi:DUF6476 family protein [Roseinatronobacter alkalisoli]|uniref:DUF6476 family protein n=1 Tax=Roseinatronobacter alkalisoli TaxID=3028235 RepID=A0ABT5TBS8_9RHOB|nr:DUF6476 family protein [Roseinatronobacter sp. HJB301]MDD7972456.1 DUF6476 family protein [Roseinatronobacter sp. HJB301]